MGGIRKSPYTAKRLGLDFHEWKRSGSDLHTFFMDGWWSVDPTFGQVTRGSERPDG